MMQTDATQLIVHATLWVLLLFSVLTWSLIVYKTVQLLLGRWRDQHFALSFWAGNASHAPEQACVMQRLHQVASSFQGKPMPPGMTLEKRMRDQLRIEFDHLETGLTLLAGIGTTSPFVGLFGTVWGIKRALQDISQSGKASLDVVAGPIGEALIATAVGIAVAVPAVLAYNFLTRMVRKRKQTLETFSNDVLDAFSAQN
ncbi:MAG: hypothetical protein RIQ52_1721 [Pseudomonadota bacterium]|jgi:biopolymer transport protein ExbB